jgi:hypothetical protein
LLIKNDYKKISENKMEQTETLESLASKNKLLEETVERIKSKAKLKLTELQGTHLFIKTL